MVSVAYQPFFKQSAIKHHHPLKQIKVAIIGYTRVSRILGSSHGESSSRSASYGKSLAFSKTSSAQRAI